MKILLLMRHAEADNPKGINDIDRPLTAQGKKDAGIIGSWLTRIYEHPGFILSSPVLRAKQTSILVAENKTPRVQIGYEDRIYEQDTSEILSLIRKTDDALDKILLTGHNPSFTYIVNFLGGSHQNLFVRMGTASVACIQSEADTWQIFDKAKLKLRWLINPRLITMQ